MATFFDGKIEIVELYLGTSRTALVGGIAMVYLYKATIVDNSGKVSEYHGTLEYILGRLGNSTPKEMRVSKEVTCSEQEEKKAQLEGQGKETKEAPG